jgi:hypothetical protein
VILTIWRTLQKKLETKLDKTPKTHLKMVNKTVAHLPLNAKDPSTVVLMATKKAGSKLGTEAAVDLSIEDLDLQATEEEGLTREERTLMTTEMLTQKHSHKYISLALREKLVKMT